MGCDGIKLSAVGFDKAVIDFFKQASNDQEILVNAIGDAILDARHKLDKIEKEVTDIEEKLKIAREASEKLLTLAMEGTISKGPAYKAKMETLDTEILILQEKLSKLEAQKQVASFLRTQPSSCTQTYALP